jgi:hypothetical protein
MTVLSKFANAYDPLLFWKRLPDELLHKIANPLVRVKDRHRSVMRELAYGPRRRCQQAFHSQWKSQWLYYSRHAPTPAPYLSVAYSMLRLLPYGVTPSGRRTPRLPIICAGDLRPRGIFREYFNRPLQLFGIAMDEFTPLALRYPHGTRHGSDSSEWMDDETPWPHDDTNPSWIRVPGYMSTYNWLSNSKQTAQTATINATTYASMQH